MITAYLTLGLMPPDSDEMASEAYDAQVRARYLQLVREVGPTRQPERFGRIAAAYPQIQSVRARARYAILGSAQLATAEAGLDALAAAVAEHSPPLGLRALAEACEVIDG